MNICDLQNFHSVQSEEVFTPNEDNVVPSEVPVYISYTIVMKSMTWMKRNEKNGREEKKKKKRERERETA